MLYSRAHFAVRHAASADRPHLAGIRFSGDGTTEATNGHILLRVSAEMPPPEEHPKDRAADALEPFTLPTNAAAKIIKGLPKRTRMPVLANAVLDVAATNQNGTARFVSTDLEQESVTEASKIDPDMEYPNTRQILEPARNAPAVFELDLLLMEKIIKAAKEFGAKTRKGAVAAKFHFTDERSAIRVTLEDADTGGEMEALIMPLVL